MKEGLVERAAAFAAKAHAGQLRKYTNEPYYNHLAAVAHLVALAPGADEVMVAAAYLHDLLEDTATTAAELEAAFGPEVTALVLELTSVYTSAAYPHLSRAKRKALDAARLATISPAAKLVKKSDIADNTATIEARDPGFAKVYLAEKAAVLKAMGLM